MSETDREICEAAGIIKSLMGYAYEMGFHEIGYNPLEVLLSEIEQLKAEREKLKDISKINNEEYRLLKRDVEQLKSERDELKIKLQSPSELRKLADTIEKEIWNNYDGGGDLPEDFLSLDKPCPKCSKPFYEGEAVFIKGSKLIHNRCLNWQPKEQGDE